MPEFVSMRGRAAGLISPETVALMRSGLININEMFEKQSYLLAYIHILSFTEIQPKHSTQIMKLYRDLATVPDCQPRSQDSVRRETLGTSLPNWLLLLLLMGKNQILDV